MAFTFQQYGTFTGTGTEYIFRDNDDFSNIFEDPVFKLNDVGMALLNTTSDYVYLHLTGSDTSNVTLERNTGAFSQFYVNAALSVFAGDVRTSYIPSLNAKAVYWDSKKPFDIPHPTKENHRLRYICLEGPQAEVYLRGKLVDNYVIELPEYWRELVDAETIGVTLTPIGSYQELFVEKIEWGTHITVKNNAGGAINCSYVVYGERKDTSKNISEYVGTSPKDYPGDNREYAINYNLGSVLQ